MGRPKGSKNNKKENERLLKLYVAKKNKKECKKN